MRSTSRHITQLNIDSGALGLVADRNGYTWRSCNGDTDRMDTYFGIYGKAAAHNRHPHMGNYYT
jgi:hypothetical protein